MGAQIKILSGGMVSSIQDQGRFGYAGLGVPRSGAADPISLSIGNALVGNEAYEPAIEFRFLGPKITVANGSVRVGLAANTQATVTLASGEGTVSILPWQSVCLKEGDILNIAPLTDDATGYVTIEGGMDLTPMLGSCSTYARASLGGVTGRNLQTGDVIETNRSKAREGYDKIVSQPFKQPKGPVRVILGPQEDYFSAEVINEFLGDGFKVSNSVDRMGVRLQGEQVSALPEKGNDLISDGIIPGTIQIPGDGQPIILFMDCQSVGGYPKIATVISTDLYRIGQLRPENSIEFKAVTMDEAQLASTSVDRAISAAIASIQDYLGVGVVNLDALYSSNLVDGIVNANNPGHFPGHLERN